MSEQVEMIDTFECPPDCGLCCQRLIVEADALDVVREPRIADVHPIKRLSSTQLPVLQTTWVLWKDSDERGDGRYGCGFLTEGNRCSIYATRPNCCVGFIAGGIKCTELRQQEGLAALAPVKRPASISTRYAAEVQAYEAKYGEDAFE